MFFYAPCMVTFVAWSSPLTCCEPDTTSTGIASRSLGAVSPIRPITSYVFGVHRLARLAQSSQVTHSSVGDVSLMHLLCQSDSFEGVHHAQGSRRDYGSNRQSG